MKKSAVSLLSLVALFTLTTAIPVMADQSGKLKNAKVEVADHGCKKHTSGKKAKMHKGQKEARAIIHAYMLAKGDITQKEINAQKAKRKKVRAELKALRKSGDVDAMDKRLAQLRKERHERREKMRNYIEANPKLDKMLEQRRKDLLEKRMKKHTPTGKN